MFLSAICSAFPQFTSLIRNIPRIPLKARSLLIKQCQAQYDVPDEIPDPCPTIIRLLQSHPQVPLYFPQSDTYSFCPLDQFLRAHEVTVQDPIIAPIVLDLLRGLPVEEHDIRLFREMGWLKEVKLGMDIRGSQVNFRPFMFHTPDPIHPDIPYNPTNLFRIRNAFRAFRQRIVDNPPTWYPRATHKNMSRSTRRDYENHFPGHSLEHIPIFGQDDWERVYNSTGIKLDGYVEIRQTWTASQAKPRTYACMGGRAYNYSRHLQEFFTDLTSIFPPTHKITRLRPGRLYVPPLDPSAHYLVYDLSSFTSNCAEQRAFCDTLAEFFDGVTVFVVDEYDGVVRRDLGEMLRDYNTHCVFQPLMSLERVPKEFGEFPEVIAHGIASLLGIFGNLMACTVAHYLIVSSVTDSFDEDNTAGDDGLIIEHDFSSFFVDMAIRLVGDYELSKTFRSDEIGAICLKRPLSVQDGRLHLEYAINPPTIITALCYLSGKEVDSRFTYHGLEDMTMEDRFKVVATDLLRFLRAAYKIQPGNISLVQMVYAGFKRLVKRTCNFDAEWYASRRRLLWPIDPGLYDFYGVDPFEMWARLNADELEIIERDDRPIHFTALRYQGDVVTGNSTPRLVLLQRLGYTEKEPVRRHLSGLESYFFLLNTFAGKVRTPQVYTYTLLKDLPEQWLYSD